MGRAKFKIDYNIVYNLAKIMCTQQEIASALGCSLRTLTNDAKFKEEFVRGQDGAKESLRRAQFDTALKGNPTLLIWLGKQYLGQKEPRDERLDSIVEDLTPLAELIKKGLKNDKTNSGMGTV